MKKVIIIVILTFVYIGSTYVQTFAFSNYLPGGKNYLSEEFFTFNGSTLDSNQAIKIKSNTTYTISFPGEGVLESPEMILYTNNNEVFDGSLKSYPNCSVDLSDTICTFTTDADDTEITISIFARDFQLYYDYYKMTDFQLEEGNQKTDYEPYIQPFIDSNSPEINGAGAFIKSYESLYLIQDIIMDHILVIDDVDGDLTSEVQIVSDAYTGNEQQVGDYVVELQATDSSGNSAYFSLTVIVKDELPPEITGPDVLTVTFDSTKTINEIITENYSAMDGYNGTVPITIEEDNYTLHKNQVGSYSVTIISTDASLNKTSKVITVDVVDAISPTLTSSNVIEVYHSNPKSYTEIVNNITYTDDYDDNATISTRVISENYSTAQNQPGTYTMVVEAVDSSGNKTEDTLTITIIDDVYPEITGPESIAFSYTENRTLDDLISLFSVSDNFSELVVTDLIITSETFTLGNNQVGTYFINLEVQDEANNTTTRIVQVDIIDDQKPIIYIDNMIITLGDNVSFTQEDALNVLIKNNEIPDDDYIVTVLNDNYTGNEHIPGQYIYSLLLEDTRGKKIQKDFVINIPDNTSLVFDETLIESIVIFSVSFGFILFAVFRKKK